jgi:hypothetical protein
VQYQDKGLMLFALQLALRIDDIDAVAATSLTDHSNDKKCDLVHVDRDRQLVVVAQSYIAQDESRPAAPANKASDLNTAVAWLLSGDISTLPEALRSAAAEVREALNEGVVSQFELWYCHNLPASENVQQELEQAARTAKGLLEASFSNSGVTSISAVEVGRERLEEMYKRTEVPIVVTDTYELPIAGGFEERSERWRAFCTSVDGEWLRTRWLEHGSDLMSPNVRDYLGIVRSERNINFGIKSTAKETPDSFWIYNNGLTVLVNAYDYEQRPTDNAHLLRVHGMGIVNGAQTTGSIGTLSEEDASRLAETRVMVRFVQCSDADVLADIVRFNNTQNKVEAADFRSKDAVQNRLRTEFEAIPEADYRGGRRGGIRDAIERSKNLLPDATVAQALAAFHGRPNLAYNETRRIWEDDAVYSQIFNDKTTARHSVFVFSLQRAVEAAKRMISEMDPDKRTASQKKYLSFFRQRGSIHLLMAAIADSLETIIGRAVPNRFDLHFKKNLSPRQAAEEWSPIVSACLPFSNQLADAGDTNLKNPEKVKEAISNFQAMIESTSEANEDKYAAFAKLVQG